MGPGHAVLIHCKIRPRDDGSGEHAAHIARRARAFARELDVREKHRVAIQQKLREPAGLAQDVGQVRKHAGDVAAHQVGRAVVQVALAQAGAVRVDGHGEDLEASLPRPLQCRHTDVATAGEVELIPQRTLRDRCNLVGQVAGETRHAEADACVARRARHRRFALRVDHAREADGAEQHRQRKIAPEHAGAQIGLRNVDGIVRAVEHLIPRPPIVAQRDFAIRTAVHVVENRSGHALAGELTNIFNIDGAI